MGRIYLVRHGRTEWNKSEIFRGKMDIPLDDLGKRQAGLVRDAISSVRLKSIVSSPLGRAKETAAIIGKAFPGTPFFEDERAGDIDVGLWGGKNLSEVRAKYPKEFGVWENKPSAMTFPQGESLRDVQERIWPLAQSFIPDLEDSDFILVSHRLTLKVLILTCLGASLDNFWKIRIDTASISVLDWDGKSLVLTRLNDTSHLNPLGTKDPKDF